MEDEDGEDRALLGGRREADSAVHGAPRALSALCDPSRLAHRLVVLSLMCFLGSRCCLGSGARFFQVSGAR